MSVRINGEIIQSVNSLRYLDFYMDSKHSFTDHRVMTSKKASAVAQKISRIMPNMGAAKPKKRRLLWGVITLFCYTGR